MQEKPLPSSSLREEVHRRCNEQVKEDGRSAAAQARRSFALTPAAAASCPQQEELEEDDGTFCSVLRVPCK